MLHTKLLLSLQLSDKKLALIKALQKMDQQKILDLIEGIKNVNYYATIDSPINSPSDRSRTLTPLHLACEIPGGEEIVNALLRKGAKADKPDNLEKTPLQYAQDKEQLSIAKILITHQPNLREKGDLLGKSPLHYAARENKIEFLKLYLHLSINDEPHFCNVNVQDNDYITPMHLAAASGNHEIVDLLLMFGADPKARDNYNCLPYSYALMHPELAVRLKEITCPSLFSLAAIVLQHHAKALTSLPLCVQEKAQQAINEQSKDDEIVMNRKALMKERLTKNQPIHKTSTPSSSNLAGLLRGIQRLTFK